MTPQGAISLLNTIENLKKISRESFINTNNISKNNNNNTKKKHSHLAFRKSRNKDNDNNTNITIKHDRGNSLGTIQSNTGTIGTMDVREYHENIHHI